MTVGRILYFLACFSLFPGWSSCLGCHPMVPRNFVLQVFFFLELLFPADVVVGLIRSARSASFHKRGQFLFFFFFSLGRAFFVTWSAPSPFSLPETNNSVSFSPTRNVGAAPQSGKRFFPPFFCRCICLPKNAV